MMKKKFSKYTRKGLPGGANEVSSYTKGVVSTEGYRIDSPDKDNPVNIINSGNITMTETDGRPLKKGPLFGMDNLGNKTIMMPGFNYQFPGSQVLEMPMAEEGMIVELSDEEIQELKDGGYIVEELPSYQDQGEVQEMPEVSIQSQGKTTPGSRIIDVVPVLETGNCPEGYEYSSERKACVKKEIQIAETTIYGDKEGKKKQRKLLDNFQLAQAAFKKWHKDAGFGNLILKGRRDKDDIKSLKGYIDDYKEELKKTKEQYAPASSALKVLKKHYPKEWKNLKLKHVFDPQSIEQLRKLTKKDKDGNRKLSKSYFKWYYDSFGKGFDQNVASGGPGGSYDAKETKDIWRDTGKDWDKLGYATNALMMGLAFPATLTAADVAALGTAAATEAQLFGGFLRNPMPTVRAIAGSTRGKTLGALLTAAGVPMAVYQDFPNMQKAIKDKEYWSALGHGGMGLLNISPFAFPAITKGYQAIKNADQIKALSRLKPATVEVIGKGKGPGNVIFPDVDVSRNIQLAKQSLVQNRELIEGAAGNNQKAIDALKYDVAKNKVALKNYEKVIAEKIKKITGKTATQEQINAQTSDLQKLIQQGEKTLEDFSKLSLDEQSKVLNERTFMTPESNMIRRLQDKINQQLTQSSAIKPILGDTKINLVPKVDAKVPEGFVTALNEQSLAQLRAKYGQNLEGLSSETRDLILSTNAVPENLLYRDKSGYFTDVDYQQASFMVNRMKELENIKLGRQPKYNWDIDLARTIQQAGTKNLPSNIVFSGSVDDVTIMGSSIGRGGVDGLRSSTTAFPEQNIIDANITRFDPGDFRFYEQTIGTGAKDRRALDEFGVMDRDKLGIIREKDLTKYIEKIDDGTIKVETPGQTRFRNYAKEKVVSTGEVGLANFEKNEPTKSFYNIKVPSSKTSGGGEKTISLTNNEIRVIGETGMDIEAVRKGEINKDYVTHLTKNIELTKEALPGAKVFGSAAGVKAGLPHGTHDIDVIMSANDYNKIKGKYKVDADNGAVVKLNVFDNAGPQGVIDVNVIQQAEDGTATGVLARELFRQFHPKKYYEAVRQQRKATDQKTGFIPELKISLTPDELIKSFDPEIKTMMDSLEAGAIQWKEKHLFRDNVYASYADPTKFQKAQEMFLRSFIGPKGKIGRQFSPSDFSDFEKNKELLSEIGFIGDVNVVAEDPIKMQNALNTFTINNTTLTRGANFDYAQDLRQGDEIVDYMNRAIGRGDGPGGRAAGENLNTVLGIASSGHGEGIKDFQGFMQLNIDNLINAKKLSPKEYIKAIRATSDGDVILTEPMVNKIVEIANKHKALGFKEDEFRKLTKTGIDKFDGYSTTRDQPLTASDLTQKGIVSKIFKTGPTQSASNRTLLANFYNDIAVAPELNFQAVYGNMKNREYGNSYYRSGLKIFDEATDAMAIDFVQFNRRRRDRVQYPGILLKEQSLPADILKQSKTIPSDSSLIEGVETVGKEGEVSWSLSTPTLDKLSSNQKDLKAMINLLDGGLIKAQQRRAQIMNDIKGYQKAKVDTYSKGYEAFDKSQQKKRKKVYDEAFDKIRLLEDQLKNIDLKISEINALKDKQVKVMSQYTKLLAVPTNIIEKSGVAEEPIRQTVDLVETGVEEGIEGVEKGVKEGTEAVVEFSEKIGESLKSPSQKRMENNKAVYKKLYGKDFSGPQMIDKNSEIKSDLRILTPGYAKRFPTKYAEKLSQLIKLKEAGFQFYKEEEKKLNKLIKENKEEGGEVKYLTDEEIEMYRAGGYVVEEL